MPQRKKYHIKRDDVVMVIAGKEKGKTGKVLKILPKIDRAVVEKVNFIKRSSRMLPCLVSCGNCVTSFMTKVHNSESSVCSNGVMHIMVGTQSLIKKRQLELFTNRLLLW